MPIEFERYSTVDMTLLLYILIMSVYGLLEDNHLQFFLISW